MLLEGLQQVCGFPDEDACIPEVIASVEVGLGGGAVGFFFEGLDGEDLAVWAWGGFDVSIAGVGAGGLDSKGEDSGVLGGIVEGEPDLVEEGIFLKDDMIRRSRDEDGVGIGGMQA